LPPTKGSIDRGPSANQQQTHRERTVQGLNRHSSSIVALPLPYIPATTTLADSESSLCALLW
jgi:hypothetical protein